MLKFRHDLTDIILLNIILPIVGMVVTISPSFSLYSIVVLPAASKPTTTQQHKIYNNKRSNIVNPVGLYCQLG